jgi:hypothetical protein
MVITAFVLLYLTEWGQQRPYAQALTLLPRHSIEAQHKNHSGTGATTLPLRQL